MLCILHELMIEFGGNMNEKREASTSPFEILKTEGNKQVDQPEKALVEAENSDATECSSSFDDSGLPDFHDDAESTLDSDGLAKVLNTRSSFDDSGLPDFHDAESTLDSDELAKTLDSDGLAKVRRYIFFFRPYFLEVVFLNRQCFI